MAVTPVTGLGQLLPFEHVANGRESCRSAPGRLRTIGQPAPPAHLRVLFRSFRTARRNRGPKARARLGYDASRTTGLASHPTRAERQNDANR
jgi:hypothetical protein